MAQLMKVLIPILWNKGQSLGSTWCKEKTDSSKLYSGIYGKTNSFDENTKSREFVEEENSS